MMALRTIYFANKGLEFVTVADFKKAADKLLEAFKRTSKDGKCYGIQHCGLVRINREGEFRAGQVVIHAGPLEELGEIRVYRVVEATAVAITISEECLLLDALLTSKRDLYFINHDGAAEALEQVLKIINGSTIEANTLEAIKVAVDAALRG